MSTPQETKEQYIKAMGKPLGELFYSLWQEVSWLHFKWEEYVVLFGTKSSRIDLMNKSAPFFFKIVKDTFWENILLHIAKLMDPPKSAGKDNLSIQSISVKINEPKLKKEIDYSISIAISKTKFCRDWRNRYIAHFDYSLAVKNDTKPLAPASRDAVKSAFSSIVDVLNLVSEYYLHSTMVFGIYFVHNGAESLLRIINNGLQVNDEDDIAFEEI